jgi:ligand-binding sensor domain-containing protein/signal transduction histidine kinase
MTLSSFVGRWGPTPVAAGLMIWFSLAGIALAASSDLRQYESQAWQSDDGLPDTTVEAIAQTDDGYLWVGTRSGLARFDGVSFMQEDEKSMPDLKGGRITALCALTDGSLWIGCTNGLYCLRNGNFFHFSETNGLPSNRVNCLLQDQQGLLWVGTAGGLARYSNARFSRPTWKNGLASNDVLSLCEDYYGTFWITTPHRLVSLSQNGESKIVSLGNGATNNTLTSVWDDEDGNLWIGTQKGLYRLGSGGSEKFYTLKDGLPDIPVTLVYEDRSGRIWIGTVGGLACMSDGRIVNRTEREGVFGDSIRAMFEDREGNLWVGAKGGVYRLNAKIFTSYGPRQGLTHDNVMSACEDAAGAVWIATWGGGLHCLKNGTITRYPLPGDEDHDLALSLCLSRAGGLWVGMVGGLYRFKDGQFIEHYSRSDGLLDAAVRVIYEDPQGALWIGTQRGLNIFKNGKFDSYTITNGLAGPAVQAICGDDQGDVWIGTDGGLTRWRAGKFTTFTTRDGISDNDVDALYYDNEQTLWIGTRSGGLNRYQAGKFTAYTKRQGLFSDTVFAIVEDDFGTLWMSCRQGIFRISKKSLNDYSEGKIPTITCRRYGKADGLISIQFSDAAKPNGWKGGHWRLWFPTFRGLVEVNTRIRPNDRLEPVVIEKVVADGRTLQQNGSALYDHLSFTAPPGQGEVEFHYAILNYREPEDCRFRFKLEGVDSHWIEAGTRRVAYYNHLRPGRYHFQVVACNEDGVWNDIGANANIVLLPYFWQTWWFMGLMGVVGVSGIVLAVRQNEKRKARRALEHLEQQHLLERERARIAKDMHDDLGGSLTRIAFLSELVKTDENKAEVDAHASKIAATARETVSALDEIVWAVNPQSDTLYSLLQYLSHYADKFLEDTPVSCRLEIPIDIPAVRVTAEVRHNLFLMVKEALNNVVKHSGATEVHLRVIIRDRTLRIEVVDNGLGLAAEGVDHQKRSGVDNMRHRLEALGGSLTMESQPGWGTKVVAQISLETQSPQE